MTATNLTTLPAAIVQRISGERRKRLLDYLMRWREYPAATAYLTIWLEAQPFLATLRQAYASVLIEQGNGAAALDLLDAIDAERGVTQSRREARLIALASLGRFDEAYALLDGRDDDAATWRLRTDLLRREGRFAEAEAALGRMAALLPDGAEPLRAAAELALAQGDAARARLMLNQRQQRMADGAIAAADVFLLRTAAELLGDLQGIAELDALMVAQRTSEDVALIALLGLDSADDAPRAIALADSPPEPTLPQEAVDALREHFGFSTLRAGQAAVIARVLAGQSVLGVLPTGAGKSLTYQLPALVAGGVTLVISPLIALMKDQIDNLPPALAGRAITINSSLEGREVGARLRGIAEGRYTLIFVAPERLRQQPFVQALRRIGVARVVVDEAHCVSLWGMSFRPDYLFIRQAVDALGNPPILALTATATPDTEREIKAHLGDLFTVRTSVFRPNLRLEVVQVPNRNEKMTAIVDLCRTISGPMVVYARSRNSCEELALALKRAGIAAEHYHAQVPDRAAVQDRFMRGETRILVATVAFGMGVDKSDVRAIIHYNLPQSVEAYYQEAGRAGRDGLPARCILLYASNDKGQMTQWLREEALSKDYLRDVFRLLRRTISGQWGLVSLEQLRRDLREEDETKLRVAVGMLERVGLLVRHFDIPYTVSVSLYNGGRDADFLRFANTIGLTDDMPVECSCLDVAAQLDIAPDALERNLIEWHQQGFIRYTGGQRDVLVELRPAGSDLATNIERLLDEYARRQNQRIEAIADYARDNRCRHRLIALHFGERMKQCGTQCDICAPGSASTRARTPASRAAPRSQTDAIGAILAAVQEHTGRFSGHELAGVLTGAVSFPPCKATGALRGADFAAVRGTISALIMQGRLQEQRGNLVLGAGQQRVSEDAFLQEQVRACLGDLPFGVGRSGLAKVLKGSSSSPIGPDRCDWYGALAHLPLARIEQVIEHMVDRGLLQRQDGPMPLLSLP